MKKLIGAMLWIVCTASFGQTFPVQNLAVNGSATFAGLTLFNTIPQSPTPSPGDASRNVATTAFVTNGFVPLSGLGGLAPINSPAFTGIPTVPAPSTGNNSQQIATTTFVQSALACVNIMGYGGDPTNTNSNNAAFTAAVAAANAASPGQICIEFPAGNFKFSAAATVTVPVSGAIMIKGAGNDVTNLIFASGNGVTVNLQSGNSTVHVRDLSLLTAGHLAGSALTLNQIAGQQNVAQSDVTNITCRGNDGFELVNVWTNCVLVQSVSLINFTNLNAAGSALQEGTGVNLSATLPSYGIVYNFQGCNFEENFVGIYYGNYIQGVTVNQSNFVAGKNGIVVPPSSAGTAQLTVTGSQFNQYDVDILFQSNLPATAIIGNYFFCTLQSTSICFSAYQPGLIQVVGNFFQGSNKTNQYGISFTLYSAPVTITGNVFWNLGAGVQLPAGTGAVNVQSNGYIGNTVNVNNAGSNTVGGGSP